MRSLRPALAILALVLSTDIASAEELVFEVKFEDVIVASGSKGLVQGDRVILNDVLFKDGAKAGSTSGVCTITDPAGVMHCAITFIFADGTISTVFANTPPPEKRFGLFGGTGVYAGREGQGVMLERGDGTGSLTLTLGD